MTFVKAEEIYEWLNELKSEGKLWFSEILLGQSRKY
jgi:hypothetical protein